MALCLSIKKVPNRPKQNCCPSHVEPRFKLNALDWVDESVQDLQYVSCMVLYVGSGAGTGPEAEYKRSQRSRLHSLVADCTLSIRIFHPALAFEAFYQFTETQLSSLASPFDVATAANSISCLGAIGARSSSV